MKIKALVVGSGLLVLGATASMVNSGCGDDDPTQAEPARLARKGEACQTTNECAAGLACLPQSSAGGGGVCVLGVFSVSQTAKECAIIECRAATDCCDNPPSQCENLKQNCDFQRDAGSVNPTSCTTYEQLCVCDTTRRDCEAGKCITKCVNDSTCTISGAGGKCLGGTCGQCSSDTDCATGGSTERICNSGRCQEKCQGDGDCPGFDRCIQGRCTAGGCQTNRECIASTRNVEATCGTDGRCIVPCQTDLECGNPRGYTFFSCVGGQCLDIGCESDKDCGLRFPTSSSSSSSSSSSGTTSGTTSGSSSGGTLGSGRHVICRDKVTPNPTTKPAQ
jgi:hypothetical protein